MKLYRFSDNLPIMHFGSEIQVEVPDKYVEKPLRGLWISNVLNIDLPTVENIELYQKKVMEMFDTCVSSNINAIFFQVRTTNDAFYESELNPYSRYFTGKEGRRPPFDVLKWIINAAKERNIEFHAWCNPYRVSPNGNLSVEEYLDTCDKLNFAKRHPEYLVLDKQGKMILNPAIKEVKQFIIDSMVEIVENYDVDGIHFDDYFYPYSGLDDNHSDLEQFSRQNLELGDFRRENVNEVIKGVYEAIKKVNPILKFGVSPFGIWKNHKDGIYGSHTDPACSESYYGQYADTLAWIKGGYIDYVVPQIYWEFGHKIAPFADICDFWAEVCKDSPVKLYIGHGAYRLGNEGEFSNPKEVVNQVKYANNYPQVQGNIFFTYHTFIDKGKTEPGIIELRKLLNGAA